MTGRLAIKQEFDNMSVGYNTIVMRTTGASMPVGMYVMQIKVNGKPVEVRKLFKQP